MLKRRWRWKKAVREAGAPISRPPIAILKGEIKAGITAGRRLKCWAQAPAGSVRKCSRRDLPIAAALQQDGATTVAGTMIIAAMLRIKLFATGGIGGVHRGQPHDVSADLIELGRTPVAVVCFRRKVDIGTCP